MRLVDKPNFAPHRCAAVPFIGQTHESARWVDTGQELGETGLDHVYLSDFAVREAMRCFGFPTPESFDEVSQERDALAVRVGELEAELTRANEYLQAIDALESAGLRARKKAGRPSKKQESKEPVEA